MESLMKKPPLKQTWLSFEPEVIAKAERFAKADDCTLSNAVNMILKRALADYPMPEPQRLVIRRPPVKAEETAEAAD
jgi:hypothetical protein